MTQFRATCTALLLCAIAVSCKPASKIAESVAPSAAPSVAIPAGEAADLIATLNPEDAAALRAALMRAHIAAAMALADDGAGADAAAQFRRPITDIYRANEAAYKAKGQELDTAKFELAAMRAEINASAADLQPLREGLDRQIERLAPRQFSRPVVIKALLTQLASEYGRGVDGQTVINPANYQDAYGLSLIALDLITAAVREGVAKDASRSSELQRQAEALVNMFPSASAPAHPAAPGEVQAQISRVQLAFPGME